MAFDDEIVRLLANRSFYLDFSHSNNPGGIDWPDPLVKLFGKVPDARGPYPIDGTVLSFGTLSRAVCNADFALEIPNLSIELVDPENFWRTRAAPPSINLLYRWITLWLRVQPSLTTPENPAAVRYFDQRISVGQITKPDFGPNKHVSLDCRLTGGKWLGEMIPRRVVTLDDFPNCPPENLGKAVPIVFGVFSNTVDENGAVTPVLATGCSPREITLLQESWSNGNGIAFDNGGDHYDANTGPGTGDDPIDPLYPMLGASEAVWVYPNLFDYGVNALWVHPDSFYGDPPRPDWVIAGVAFRQFASGLPDEYNGHPGGTYRPFDATSMWASFTYYPDEDIFIDNVGFGPMYEVWDDYGYTWGFVLWCEDSYYDEEGVWHDVNEQPIRYLHLEYGLWNYATQNEDEGDAYVVWGTRDELVDTKQVFVVCHKCGTYTYDPVTDMATVADDGYFRVFVNGTLKIAVENIPLTIQSGWYEEAGRDKSNYAQTISFGWYGLIGPLTGIRVTSGIEEKAVAKCKTEPGTSLNMASGALRGLLVDVGKTPLETGTETSGDVDATLPAVDSHEAHNIFGGGTINKAVFFYVAARKTDGTIGPLSAIVDLDNDYDPDQAAHAASLSWRQAGSATGYIVWMSQDFNFHPIDRPTLGSPRTKTISAHNGSSFPPISGDPFDYQVIFTSLTDGSAYGAASTDPEDPDADPGYRYLLAGHTLKSVDQVYVLKPVPTVTEDSQVNLLVSTVQAGGAIVTVVYNDTSERFREGQSIIIAGDLEAYDVVAFDEGTMTITPPARVRLEAGATVSTTTDVDTQVLQIEGTDYTQEVIEINGNRYHTLVFEEPLQNEETCEQYEVTANVQGTEAESDGTGILITDGVSMVQHFFKNWIFNDYRSSIGDFAPDGNKWFEDVPYAPGLINNDSFYATNLITSGRVPGNYQGAGALTEQIPASQLITDLITSFDLDLYFDNSSGTCAWSVSTLDTELLDRETLPAYTPEDDTIRGTFRVEFDLTPHANVIQYFAGPLTGRVLGQSSDQNGGWLVAGEIWDPSSIGMFGRLHSPPMELKWTRHAPTAYDVAHRRLRMTRIPPVHARMSVPIGTVNDSLVSIVKVTHPDGLGANGWVDRVCRVMRSDIDLDQMMLHLLLRDIDDLVG